MRLIEKGWNGRSFVAYRATRRLFYPNDGANVYLVGLVGFEAWSSDGGRLQSLKTGTPGTYNGSNPSLQYFQYDYDNVGNVNWVRDHKATGAAQTHQFTYDALDRVVTASATNASGGADGGLYSESCAYNANGLMTTGPLGAGYTYGNSAHKHAVTAVGSNTFAYDGNQTSRTVGGQSYALTYDAESRLVSVSGASSASFGYDGDNGRVKGSVNGNTSIVRKYYYAGNRRIAMRENGSLRWLLGDHLGSTAYTVNGATKSGEVRYRAFGATRFTSGTTPTSYRYTGQREEAGLGLYYYGARGYDPALGHFIGCPQSADTIIPDAGNGLGFHRPYSTCCLTTGNSDIIPADVARSWVRESGMLCRVSLSMCQTHSCRAGCRHTD